MSLVTFHRWGNGVLVGGGLSSRVLRSKSSHRSRSSVESPCQLSPDSVLTPPDGDGRAILCVPSLHGKLIQEQLCPGPVAARTSLQKTFTSGNSHQRGAVAQLLAPTVHPCEAWCSARRSREDLPHSLNACSPDGFFSFCGDLFFCNSLRVWHSTGFQVNGEVECRSKNQIARLFHAIFSNSCNVRTVV